MVISLSILNLLTLIRHLTFPSELVRLFIEAFIPKLTSKTFINVKTSSNPLPPQGGRAIPPPSNPPLSPSPLRGEGKGGLEGGGLSKIVCTYFKTTIAKISITHN